MQHTKTPSAATQPKNRKPKTPSDTPANAPGDPGNVGTSGEPCGNASTTEDAPGDGEAPAKILECVLDGLLRIVDFRNGRPVFVAAQFVDDPPIK